MKILSITSIRSDFDLLSPLYDLFLDDTDLDFKLLVCGSHLSASFGHTVDHIRSRGYPILVEIESLIDSDSPSSRLKSASIMLISSIDTIRTYSPDILIVTGDREDCLMGALTGAYLGIPVIHMYGGDHACDGHVDNPVRHAVSKLSTAHFVTHETHKQRLLSLGEDNERIFVVGNISLDRFCHHLKQFPESKTSPHINHFSGANLRSALVIYHSLGHDVEDPLTTMQNILESLVQSGYQSFVLSTNTDPGHLSVVNACKKLSSRHPDRVTLLGTLPNIEFIQLYRDCDLLIGNSSSGILEASTLHKPAINVGLRQQGRLAPSNVIFSSTQTSDIISAIQQVNHPSFVDACRLVRIPYGDGKSANNAYNLIKTIDFHHLLRKTSDPIDVNRFPIE